MYYHVKQRTLPGHTTMAVQNKNSQKQKKVKRQDDIEALDQGLEALVHWTS